MCKKTKPVARFHKSTLTKSGYSSYCSPCKYEANKRSNEKRLTDNRVKFLNQRKNWHLKQMYGISLDEYNRLLEIQNGVCAICFKSANARMLAVDHCHKSKKVRGLLCEKCNRGIGMFHDNPQTIISAAKYLER